MAEACVDFKVIPTRTGLIPKEVDDVNVVLIQAEAKGLILGLGEDINVYHASSGEPQPLVIKLCLEGYHRLLPDSLLLVLLIELDPLLQGAAVADGRDGQRGILELNDGSTLLRLSEQGHVTEAEADQVLYRLPTCEVLYQQLGE